jgi:hypothetical protein
LEACLLALVATVRQGILAMKPLVFR